MGSKKHRQKFQRSPQPHAPSPPQTFVWLSRPRPRLYLSLLLIGLTLVVYARVGSFEIIDFDDADYVGDNLYVNHGLTPTSIAWAFNGIHYANWIPLTWLSLMLDATIFGRWPGGNHITNLVLHTANVLLVFATFTKATGNAPRSAFVAALFAVHPLHVESVAWISERKDVLSMLFGLLALYSYVSYALGRGFAQKRGQTPDPLWLESGFALPVGGQSPFLGKALGRRLMLLGLAWLLFAASLMAKQTFVTLPFLFLLLDFWPLGRLTGDAEEKVAGGVDAAAVHAVAAKRRILLVLFEKIPFLALTAAFCVVAMIAQSSSGAIPDWIPLTARVLNALLVYGLYLWRAFWPGRLAPFYPLPAGELDVVGLGISVAALAAITGFALVNVRKRPYVFTGWFWYLGSLVPVIGLVQIGRQQMADRYTYLPMLGIYLLLAWLVPSLIPEGSVRKRFLPIAAGIVVVVYAALGFRQVGYWRDGVTLFQHTFAVTEDNPTVRRALASALFRKERFREALPHLQQAVKQDPNDPRAHYSLGRGWEAVGYPDDAFAEYQKAIALDEAYPDAQNDVGLSLVMRGKLGDAERHFKRAIEIDPAYASGYGNLGMLYARTGQPAQAIELCEKALRLDPGLLQCNQTIATALASEGRFDEAIARMQIFLRAEPGNQDAQAELARITALKEARLR